MTVKEIISMACSMAHTQESQMVVGNPLQYFNLARAKVFSIIRNKVDEDHFFEMWTRSAEATQPNNAYTLPKTFEDSEGIMQLQKVEVKYGDSDYVKATSVRMRDLPDSWEWYLANQPKINPIYCIADNQIWIAPKFSDDDILDTTPAEDSFKVVPQQYISENQKQIRLSGLRQCVDLKYEDEDVGIPSEYHIYIAHEMLPYIYRERGREDKATQATMENVNLYRTEMIGSITDFDVGDNNRRFANDYLPDLY